MCGVHPATHPRLSVRVQEQLSGHPPTDGREVQEEAVGVRLLSIAPLEEILVTWLMRAHVKDKEDFIAVRFRACL